MPSIQDIISYTDDLKGQFTVGKRINHTRCSTTFKALWEKDSTRQPVIIKALHTKDTSSSEMARFIQECDLIKKNPSDGIVNLLDVIKFKGSPALFLEWFDGIPLIKKLDGKKCPVEQFLPIAIKLAEILGTLHSRNIIHREINPHHILLSEEQLKLNDFGIASTLTKENEELFHPEVIEKFLNYISPEQTGRMNRPVDYRTDFYSLGITFYEMLTGTLPFNSDDPMQIIHSHLAIMPAPPFSTHPETPEVISDLVMKLLAKNAESRYQSGFGLLADLKLCWERLINNGVITPFKLAQKDIPIKYSIPQVIIGRDDQLQKLISAFTSLGSSTEKMMMVAGEPGVGKSALINELQKPIVAKRGYFLSGKYDQFKKDVPYSAIVQAFQKLVRQILAESQENQEKWREKLLKAFGATGKIITDVIPDTKLLVGDQPDIPELGPEETKNRFNNMFSNFVSIFTRKKHPVVLFLDDLQWADSASLNLIKQLVSDPGIEYLFLIGAYRHTEVYPSHPMTIMTEDILKENVLIENILLQPLDPVNVNRLLARFMKSDEEKTKELSYLVYKKTGGNPFFINQFVKTLYEENYLRLNPVDGWEWDINELEQLEVTDNVVSLMTQKLKKFRRSTRDILKICACIGNRFDLETMSTIYEKPIQETLADINDAIEEGLVYLDEEYYKFLHDRIQEAAYSLLEEKEREYIHHKIADYFLKTTPAHLLIEKILYIVGHLNSGMALARTEREKEKIIHLNLMAADKSKRSTAYNESLIYLETCINLLEENCWETQYDLSIEVYIRATDSAFLSGEYEAMEGYAKIALKHARTLLEKTEIQRIQILAMIARVRTKDALLLGLKVLKSLGVSLPKKAGKLRLIMGLVRVGIALRGKDVDTLLNLPEMRDPHKLMAMNIITCIGSPVYMIAPNLYPLLGFERILLSIKYGNNADSQIGYVSYGLIMAGVLGKTDLGDSFGKMAIKLSEKYQSSRSRVYCVYNSFVSPWKNSLKENLPYFIKAYHMGIESGEFEFSAYNLQFHCMVNYFVGTPLPQVEELTEKHFQAISRLKQAIPFHLHILLRQQILLLTGTDKFEGQFTGSAFDKNEMLPKLFAADARVSLLYYYTASGIVFYILGEYEKAVDLFIKADEFVDSAKGFFLTMVVLFYDALSCAATIDNTDKYSRKFLLNRLRKRNKKFKLWARNSPSNNAAKYHIVQAEFWRITKNTDKAIKHYNLAIEMAQKYEFIYEEAVANELYFKFWTIKGQNHIAVPFLKNALRCYEVWGAKVKVNRMKEKYSDSMKAIHFHYGEGDNMQVEFREKDLFAENLDTASIIKTSQAISREMDLGKLLENLIKIIIENAGAEKGFLIIENQDDQKLYIQAKGSAGKEIQVLQSQPLNENKELCVAIVHYVHKTQKNLIINDARNDENFANDPYILKNKSRSILCSPIKRKEKVSGIVYIENNLSTNAFTPERLRVLQLFSSQAAISLENSILLSQREKSIRIETEMMLAAELQSSLVPDEPLIDGFEISGYMKPADEVGGDYFDVITSPFDNSPDWIIIGDVSGHGIQAGLIMLMVQTSMQLMIRNDYNISPSILISEIDKVITSNITKMKDSKYMTISALAISKKDGHIRHSGRHQDICIYRKNTKKIELVESSGIWLGLGMNEIEIKENPGFYLSPGDVLLLFTDGITESVDSKGSFFSQEKLVHILEKEGELPPKEIKASILSALSSYKANDDMSLLILKKNN